MDHIRQESACELNKESENKGCVRPFFSLPIMVGGPEVPHVREGRYAYKNKLGRGSYGFVSLAIDTKTQNLVAIKAINIRTYSAKKLNRCLREVNFLKKLAHQNMDYKHCLHTTAAGIIRQILLGVKYLHKHRIVHRDLKPSNVLIDGLTVKIADLGFAKRLPKNEIYADRIGTPSYMAPETLKLQQDECLAFPRDVWSIGCIFLFLLNGNHLFQGATFSEVNADIQQKLFTEDLGSAIKKLIPKFYFIDKPGRSLTGNLAVLLLKKMLKEDPSERSTAKRCLRHKYVKSTLAAKGAVPRATKLSFEDVANKNTKTIQAHLFFAVKWAPNALKQFPHKSTSTCLQGLAKRVPQPVSNGERNSNGNNEEGIPGSPSDAAMVSPALALGIAALPYTEPDS